MVARAIILTAIPNESEAVRRQLADITRVYGPSNEPYRSGTLPFTFDGKIEGFWQVILAETGAGNVEAAILAEKLYQHFRPQALLFIGVAGALSEALNLYDVVVATDVTYYERGKVAGKFVARTQSAFPNWRLLKQAQFESGETAWIDRLQALGVNDAPKVHLLPIAAGEKVITNPNAPIVAHIRKVAEKAAVVEMEGYGFLKALYTNDAQGLIVRSVSDRLKDKNTTEFGSDDYRQQHASLCAAAFALEVLSKLKPEIRSLPSQNSRRKFSIQLDDDISEVNVGESVSRIKLFTNDGSIVTVNIRKGSAILEFEASVDACELLYAADRAGLLGYIFGGRIRSLSFESGDIGIVKSEVAEVIIEMAASGLLPDIATLDRYLASHPISAESASTLYHLLLAYAKKLRDVEYYDQYDVELGQGLVDKILQFRSFASSESRKIPLDLKGVDFKAVSFANFDIGSGDLRYSNFEECIFDNCTLDDALCEQSSFRFASFKSARMVRARLNRCNLSFAQFANAICSAAIFDFSNITSANFADADLHEASFSNVNIEDAIGLSPGQLNLRGQTEEQKDNWSVILKVVGEKKIEVIKEARAITGLGLKEAKDLVEAAPKPVKEGVDKAEAERVANLLANVGAIAVLTNGVQELIRDGRKKDQTLILMRVPSDKKVHAIKEVRQFTGMGLKEAKDLVESLPKILKKNMTLDDATVAKTSFEKVGADVSIETDPRRIAALVSDEAKLWERVLQLLRSTPRSQVEIASQMEVSASTVSRWRSGKVRPHRVIIDQLLSYLSEHK
jgi:ribosomal protein L7/L12